MTQSDIGITEFPFGRAPKSESKIRGEILLHRHSRSPLSLPRKTMATTQAALRILNLTANASKQDVKHAYRRLAKECHPDANPHNAIAAQERFKRLSEAYTTLTQQPHALDDHRRSRARSAAAASARHASEWGPDTGFASRPNYDTYTSYMDFNSDSEMRSAAARVERDRSRRTLVGVCTLFGGLVVVTLSARSDNRRLAKGELVHAFFNQNSRRWEVATAAMRRDPMLSAMVHLKPPDVVYENTMDRQKRRAAGRVQTIDGRPPPSARHIERG